MNKSDTERIYGMLKNFGYEQTSIEKEADLLIVNTCSIRQLSADKAYSRLGVWGKWKEKRPWIKIGMCGCVAQQDKNDVFRRATYVDLVFGTHNIYELPNLLKEIENGNRVLATDETPFPENNEYGIIRAKGVNAWIPIIEGCNNFCTYCIVPYTRGRERSRKLETIISEAKDALAQGFKEITLLGQNVDSYGKDFKDGKTNLSLLLKELNKLDGNFRIRFVTSYPTDITDELIETVKNSEKVCEYFHIPMQSGNSEVLKAMNRRYNYEQYAQIVKKIRDTFEDVTITSDFIAGFPGETEEQFQDTLKAIKELELDYSNTAAYSPRERTVAAKWVDKYISEETKKERLGRLNETNRESCLASNKKYIGKTLEVLVESFSEIEEKTVLNGRARNNKIVHFEGAQKQVGDFINVKIENAKTWYLSGTQF